MRNGRAPAGYGRTRMVRTPWGESEQLRTRKLHRTGGLAQDEAERSQRERLFGATVAATTVKGYAKTSVADLLRLSGVSRNAFYKLFASKEECFLATAEEIVDTALAVVDRRYRRADDWNERARDAFTAFFGLLADQPAAARLVLVESYAAGPNAVALVERAVDDFETRAREALTQLPGREDVPPRLVRSLMGGLREVMQTRLRRGEESRLIALAPELLEAALGYRSPPQPLLEPRRRSRRSPQAAASAAAPLHRDPTERIVAAATATMASRGYGAATLEAIVAEASVSLSTFYEHFDGKESALAAALDAGQARMFAAASPAYRRAREWPEAVRAAIGAIFRFLATEPDFARLGIVEILCAGHMALERRERTVERLRTFLDPGRELAPAAGAAAAELAVGSALALVYEEVRNGRVAGLPGLAPLATFIVLSPFLGAEDAGTVAQGRGPGRQAMPAAR